MTETNPTPAEAIPFALVNESGHLTGKPAEGVAAMIQAATEDLKAKLTEATAKAGIDEAAVEKIITDHENDILKAWQADPAYAKMISTIRDKQIWKGKNQGQRPGDFWLYLLSTLHASSGGVADLMGYLTGEIAKGNNWAPVTWEEITGGQEQDLEFLDYFDGGGEGITRLFTSPEGHTTYGSIFWALAVEAIAKISSLRKIELDGDYLKVVPKTGRPVYIPVLREKPGA